MSKTRKEPIFLARRGFMLWQEAVQAQSENLPVIYTQGEEILQGRIWIISGFGRFLFKESGVGKRLMKFVNARDLSFDPDEYPSRICPAK